MRVVKWFLAAIGVLIALAVAIPVGYVGSAYLYESIFRYTHHFRITLEVEDHGEIRSGSSVIGVSMSVPAPWIRGLVTGSIDTRGEAVVVELSTGQVVVATLGHGPTGSGDRLYYLAALALDRYEPFFFVDAPNWEGSAELTGDLVPLLVTFDDIDDPFSIRAVRPGEFSEVFGSGIRFRSMWLEMTSDPITKNIESKMPFLAERHTELGRLYGTPVLRPRAPLFIKGK